MQIRSIYDTDVEPGRISGKKKGSFPSFLQYVTILRFPFFDFTRANALRTFVSVLKISSLSSSFGKPTYSVLSRRPGLNIAGSIISTVKKKTKLSKTLNRNHETIKLIKTFYIVVPWKKVKNYGMLWHRQVNFPRFSPIAHLIMSFSRELFSCIRHQVLIFSLLLKLPFWQLSFKITLKNFLISN